MVKKMGGKFLEAINILDLYTSVFLLLFLFVVFGHMQGFFSGRREDMLPFWEVVETCPTEVCKNGADNCSTKKHELTDDKPYF